MTDIDFGSFFVQLVTAGNDTTKTMLSSGLLALLEHPDQLAELRADPDARSPARSRRSCATRTRCTTSGAPRPPTPSCAASTIKAGDKVAMYLHVGEPRRGRVRRPAALRHPPPPEPAPVVRHRRALLPRRAPRPARRAGCSSRSCSATFPTIELTGEPVRVRSNLNNALKSLPVRLRDYLGPA